MARKGNDVPAKESANGSTDVAEATRSKIASRDIGNAEKTKTFLGALVGDVMNDEVDRRVAQTAIAGVNTLLKVVDMEHKYGYAKPERENGLSFSKPFDAKKSQRRAELIKELEALDASNQVTN